jgi:hypothetical protein
VDATAAPFIAHQVLYAAPKYAHLKPQQTSQLLTIDKNNQLTLVCVLLRALFKQAGAAKVYAVEASGMAKYAQSLASSNAVGKAIQVRRILRRLLQRMWL